MIKLRKLIALLAVAAMAIPSFALAKAKTIRVDASQYAITESGAYTSMAEVAVYLSVYARLPGNFIPKRDAQSLGWDSRAGNLNDVAPGKSIGGDRFGNYEGLLPEQKGRVWTECDIDSDGGYRNGLRIVYSKDGLIYYSDDHYETFTQVVVEGSPAEATKAPADSGAASGNIQEGASYTTRDEVAAYLHQFGSLPPNYLTRAQAKVLGWSGKKDNLGIVAQGYAIGGDSFGNREGLLPDASGRRWYECDVDITDGHRSDRRLVYSNDGLIYFTPDAHQTFERLY